MITMNEHYLKLQASYLFSDIAKRVKDYQINNELMQSSGNPNIKFLLPPGAPPYRDYQGDTNEPNPTYLYSQIRKLYLFIEGGRKDLNQVKREQIFITMLEAIHPREAELLLQVKEKKIKCKGLTYNLVKETFPDLLN